MSHAVRCRDEKGGHPCPPDCSCQPKGHGVSQKFIHDKVTSGAANATEKRVGHFTNRMAQKAATAKTGKVAEKRTTAAVSGWAAWKAKGGGKTKAA